jgi:hypothetical protein
MFADADGPEIVQPFQVQGRVVWMRLEEGKILIRQRSDLGWQGFI